MKKKEKCYLYIRVSTAMQVDGYSLDAQKDRLVKFAEFQGMEIVREYCDAGKSGKSITGRPEFQKMLQDVADGRDEVSYILVFKLSRFGRNAADVLNSLQYIQDYGVNLICVEDGIDSSKDSGKLTITVLSAVAEIERENILVQTMEGRRQKAREGKWNGGQAPFGYLLDSKNSTLIVNPEEAEIVRIIFDKFVHTDMGADSISNYLNQHGYSKKKLRDQEVSHFSRSTIIKILDNPVYAGKIAYGKSVTEKVKFPVILTDNGSEFSNPKEIECRDTVPCKRTNVFYCDSSAPYQKGACEVNPELIRRILPKGSSFDDLTQEDISLMMDHINSYKRKKLNNRSPYETFSFYYGEDVLKRLGCSPVAAENIILKPKLLKK